MESVTYGASAGGGSLLPMRFTRPCDFERDNDGGNRQTSDWLTMTDGWGLRCCCATGLLLLLLLVALLLVALLSAC